MLYVGDARSLTSYSPSCEVDAKLMKQSGLNDNYGYRLWLEANASSLIGQLDKQAYGSLLNVSYCNKCGRKN